MNDCYCSTDDCEMIAPIIVMIAVRMIGLCNDCSNYCYDCSSDDCVMIAPIIVMIAVRMIGL